MKDKYWKVECTRHLEKKFETRINTQHISEKGLKAFIEILVAKYALSDNEILEQHLRIPFKKIKNHVQITRTNDVIHG